MTEKEGVLRLQPSGRWAVCRPGREPVEIASGGLFRIEVDGELKPTRMEFHHFTGPMKGRDIAANPANITRWTAITCATVARCNWRA